MHLYILELIKAFVLYKERKKFNKDKISGVQRGTEQPGGHAAPTPLYSDT